MEITRSEYLLFYEILYWRLFNSEFNGQIDSKNVDKLTAGLWLTKFRFSHIVPLYFSGLKNASPRYFYRLYTVACGLADDTDTLRIDDNCYLKALVYLQEGFDQEFKALYNFKRLHQAEGWAGIYSKELLAQLHNLFFTIHPCATPRRETGLEPEPDDPNANKPLPKPPPDNDFHHYSCGKFEIPITIIACCFDQPYRQNEVKIHFKDEFFEERSDYPSELTEKMQDLLDYSIREYKIGNRKNNPLYRIDDVDQEPEDQKDNRGDLVLHFSKTRYDNLLATNMALEAVISPGKTLRQKYGFKPYKDLSKSVMSNALGTECVVISNDINQSPQRQVLVRKRDEIKVNFYRGYYQTSASGYMSLDHVDGDGNPSPFVTASRETMQEVSYMLADVEPDDFSIVAFALHWHGLYPNAIGYFNTSRPVVKLLGDPCRDGFEGHKEAIPFTIVSVLNHLSKNKWTPMSAFAMIAVLCAEFPAKEVEDAAKKLSKGKTLADFDIN